MATLTSAFGFPTGFVPIHPRRPAETSEIHHPTIVPLNKGIRNSGVCGRGTGSLAKIKDGQVNFGAWNAWDYGAVESHDH